jgi:hypothetical protein
MPVYSGRRIRVAEIILQAQAQGCELTVSPLRLVTPDGTFPVRYLFNRKTKQRFQLVGYEDSDYMLESEISNAERRLGVTLQ